MENYDTNKDGYLDAKECKRLLEDAMDMDISVDDVEKWIVRFDKNKDGKLSIREMADALDLA